jgi:cytosine/adenosine deaminase-related metal-dependent hydrolase
MRNGWMAAAVLGVCGAAGAQEPSPKPAGAAKLEVRPLDTGMTVFRDVHVVTMTPKGTLQNQLVVVNNGRIETVTDKLDMSTLGKVTVIECGGKKWLIPGLSDMHVHFPPEPGNEGDAAWRAASLLVANGVTTARGMIGSKPNLDMRQKLAAGELLGPWCYFASPPLNVQSAKSPEQAREKVRFFKAEGFDLIKAHRLVVPAIFEALHDEAAAQGIAVAGHVDNEVGLDRAYKVKMQIEHLDGMLGALVPEGLRETFVQMPHGQVKEQADLGRVEGVVKEMKGAGVWATPTLALFEVISDVKTPTADLVARPENKYILPKALTQWGMQRDHNRAEGPFAERGLGEWFTSTRAHMVREMKKQGVPIMAGSDSPQFFLVTGFALHDELAALVRAGLTPLEALHAATAAPAEYLRSLPGQGSAVGVAPDFGRIEAGLRGDLVLLGADPTSDISATRKIEGVVVRGRWLDRTALDGLLAEVVKSVGT